ncbi:MAG: methylated-DNA--[protein]-cysteine S-methyltransferase [Planctomycetota bacterium]
MNTPRSIRDRESYPAQRGVVDSPLGPIAFATDDESVIGIWLGRAQKPDARLKGIARDARDQLREYLKGKRRVFDLPLAFDLAPFTARVLAEVEGIPWGETKSYGEVAKLVGSPGAARAVGQAMGKNPIPIVIPCHRVVAAQRKIGGFTGGMQWKEYLLHQEGWQSSGSTFDV